MVGPDDGQQTASLSRAAVGGTAYLAIAQCVSLVAGYVVAVVLGRNLGPELYGVYGVVISVLIATELIGRLGIPEATAKLVAEVSHVDRSLERTSITLTALTFPVLALLFAACAPALARAYDIENGTYLFRLAALDIPFYGMFFCLQFVLNGQRRFGTQALGVVLYGVSKALGILALLLLGVTVEAALWVNVSASVIGCAYFATRLPRSKFRPSLKGAGAILSIAAPIAFFTTGLQVLQNLDLWCLKWFGAATDVTVGHYVAAHNLARLPSVVQLVVIAVLVPTLSRANSVGDQRVVSNLALGGTRFMLVVLIPLCAYLAFRSEALIELVYSASYLEGARFQALLVVRFGLLGVVLSAFCSMLIALGRPRRAAALVLCLVPIGLGANASLIASQGAVGAALAMIVTTGIGTVAAGLTLRGRVARLIPIGAVLRSLIATGILAGALSLWSVSPSLLIPELAGVALAYGLLLVMVGGVTREELGQLVGLWRSRKRGG